MFFLFLILTIGPAIASRWIPTDLVDNSQIMYLQQPVGWHNNDTTAKTTGKTLNNIGAPAAGGNAASSAAGGGADPTGDTQIQNPFSSAGAKRAVATAMFLYNM